MYDGTRLKSTAKEIAKIIVAEKGDLFMADSTGMTDKFDSDGVAQVVYINAGNGYVQSVAVPHPKYGVMYYVGPFEIEQMPTSEQMFWFHCTRAFMVRTAELGPPPRTP
jgi:hypothetical protein